MCQSHAAFLGLMLAHGGSRSESIGGKSNNENDKTTTIDSAASNLPHVILFWSLAKSLTISP